MSESPDEELPDDMMWWTFENQTLVGHALIVLVGVAVWFGVYVYWLDVVVGNFQFATIGGSEAIDARREAWQVATTACFLWFSLAVVAGKGGPYLNTFVYPILLLGLGPWITALLAFGSWPRGVFTTARRWSIEYLVHAFSIFVPGYFITVVIIGLFILVLYVTGKGEEWADKHMPEQYHRRRAIKMRQREENDRHDI